VDDPRPPLPPGKKYQSGLVVGPPCENAALALAQLVENPPVPPLGKDKKIYTQKDVAVWRKWWEENKAKYEGEQTKKGLP
jgi:hypothetical protein